MRKAKDFGASRQIESTMGSLPSVEKNIPPKKTVVPETKSARIYINLNTETWDFLEERSAALNRLTGINIPATEMVKRVVEKNQDWLTDQFKEIKKEEDSLMDKSGEGEGA